VLRHFGHDFDVSSRKVSKDQIKLRKLAIREINKSITDLMRSFRAGTYNLKNYPRHDDDEDDASHDDDDDE
jgi:hypothetical protein